MSTACTFQTLQLELRAKLLQMFVLLQVFFSLDGFDRFNPTNHLKNYELPIKLNIFTQKRTASIRDIFKKTPTYTSTTLLSVCQSLLSFSTHSPIVKSACTARSQSCSPFVASGMVQPASLDFETLQMGPEPIVINGVSYGAPING